MVASLKDHHYQNIGEIIDLEINKINSIYENVEINKYVIMPNHIHMIIILYNGNGRSKTVPTIQLYPQVRIPLSNSASKKAKRAAPIPPAAPAPGYWSRGIPRVSSTTFPKFSRLASKMFTICSSAPF